MIPRSLPYINFILASSSLGFQLGVLYPWHVTLDNAFAELQKSHSKQLNEHIKLYDSHFSNTRRNLIDLSSVPDSITRLV